MRRKKILLCIILFFPIKVKSQDNSKISLCSGLGNYETFFVGMGWQTSLKNILYLSVGDNFGVSKEHYFNITFEDKLYILSSTNAPFSLHGKLIYWQNEDKYFEWATLGISPAVGYTHTLSDTWHLEINAGIVFNIHLKSERKNYLRAGWPKQVDWNTTLKVIYNFKQRKK